MFDGQGNMLLIPMYSGIDTREYLFIKTSDKNTG
jgi:hypothetical protein